MSLLEAFVGAMNASDKEKQDAGLAERVASRAGEGGGGAGSMIGSTVGGIVGSFFGGPAGATVGAAAGGHAAGAAEKLFSQGVPAGPGATIEGGTVDTSQKPAFVESTLSMGASLQHMALQSLKSKPAASGRGKTF